MPAGLKGFQKGHSVAKGRAGVPNKVKTTLEKLQEKFPGYDPVESMAAIANDKKNDITIRFKAHSEVAQYTHAKRKSIEVSGELDTHQAPVVNVIVKKTS